MADDALSKDDYSMNNLDEHRQRMLAEEDENEDFLVEGIWYYLHIRIACKICTLFTLHNVFFYFQQV